jgi:hypothetical protein
LNFPEKSYSFPEKSLEFPEKSVEMDPFSGENDQFSGEKDQKKLNPNLVAKEMHRPPESRNGFRS